MVLQEAESKLRMVFSFWNLLDVCAFAPPLVELLLVRGAKVPFQMGRFDFRWFKILRSVTSPHATGRTRLAGATASIKRSTAWSSSLDDPSTVGDTLALAARITDRRRSLPGLACQSVFNRICSQGSHCIAFSILCDCCCPSPRKSALGCHQKVLLQSQIVCC